VRQNAETGGTACRDPRTSMLRHDGWTKNYRGATETDAFAVPSRDNDHSLAGRAQGSLHDVSGMMAALGLGGSNMAFTVTRRKSSELLGQVEENAA
jgi:hypothetical protein